MLTRKPYVGETLIYQEAGRDPVEITVTKYGGAGFEPIKAKFPDSWFCGNEVFVHWKYSNGELNPNLYHKTED